MSSPGLNGTLFGTRRNFELLESEVGKESASAPGPAALASR
jgi:hypothetical protein